MTKSKEKLEITKSAVTEALWQLLREKPLGKIRLQEVADRAGLSRSTVYVHFSDLDDILLSCARDYYVCINRFYRDRYDAVAQPDELRSLLAQDYLRAATLIQASPRLFEEIERHHDSLRGSSHYVDFRQESIEKRSQVIAQVFPDASTYAVPLEYIAVCVLEACDHRARKWISAGFDMPAEQMALQMADIDLAIVGALARPS